MSADFVHYSPEVGPVLGFAIKIFEARGSD